MIDWSCVSPGRIYELRSRLRRAEDSSPNDAPLGKSSSARVRVFSGAWSPPKDCPEPESLIAGARDHSTAIWAHGEIEYSVGVACETGDLRHGGVLPDDNLVLAVAMRRYYFVGVLRPGNVAYLTARVDLVDHGPANRIVEDDSPISRSSTRCEQALLVRRP